MIDRVTSWAIRQRLELGVPHDAPAHVQQLAHAVLDTASDLRTQTLKVEHALHHDGIDPKSAEGLVARREELLPLRLRLREQIERARAALANPDVSPAMQRKLDRLLDGVELDTRGQMGPNWSRLADGRVWRVKHGRDFDLTIPEFSQAAQAAAALTGKRVLIGRDRKNPDVFIWIQFLDGSVMLGDPCPCGATELIRIRGHIVRCKTCGSSLFATPPPPPEPVVKGRRPRIGVPEALNPERTLARHSAGGLRLVDSTEDERRYEGFATSSSDERVFVAVRVPLVEGSPVPDASTALGWAHEILEERPTDRHEDDVGPWDVLL
jgi:hypothetical protein